MPKKKTYKVAVEGNVGSGKTTFLNYFEQFPFIKAYYEPIEKWRNLRGHNFLNLHYEDMKKYSATFQSYVLLTRIQLQLTNPQKGITIQLFERSVQSNRYCFLENGLQSGTILPIQYSVHAEWYDWIEDNIDISLDVIVYLKTHPDVVMRRVYQRGRLEEKTISMDYVQSLHNSHEDWLNNTNGLTPVLTLDANQPFEDVIKACQQKLPALFNKSIPWSLELIKSQP